MGNNEAKITNKAKALSAFVSDMPLIENSGHWSQLFDIYQEYVDDGGNDPKIISLLERTIEKNFKPVRKFSDQLQRLINACYSYLGKPKPSRNVKSKHVPITKKPDESSEDFRERKALMNTLAAASDHSAKLKKAAHVNSKANLNKLIIILAHKMGFPKIAKIDRETVSDLLDKAEARPKIVVKEGDWIYETILNNITRNNQVDGPMKRLIASKAYENLMNADKPYDPDRSKGERVKFIQGACKGALTHFYGKKGSEVRANKVKKQMKDFVENWIKTPELIDLAATGRGFNPVFKKRNKKP